MSSLDEPEHKGFYMSNNVNSMIEKLDPVNDGRHKLENRPLERESIPYVISLPEHELGAFVYTWVNKDSVAGSVFVVYGPGVGGSPWSLRVTMFKCRTMQTLTIGRSERSI